jgi:hypothetical protein
MSEIPPEPHPLDAPDSYEGSPVAPKSSNSRLLRLCLIVLVASAAIAFLSGVAASNAPPSSTMETISSTVNRISAVVMLIGFCGILLAYRMPQWRQSELKMSGMHWVRSDYLYLVMANVAGAGLLLGFNMLVAPLFGISMVGAVYALLSIYIALLVTMVVWHKDYLRAYAIGVLTVFGLQAFAFMGMISAWTYGQVRGGGSLNWQLSVLLLTAVLAGLICAGYVRLLSRFRADQDAGR